MNLRIATAAALAAGLLLTGCGGSSSNKGSSASATAATTSGATSAPTSASATPVPSGALASPTSGSVAPGSSAAPSAAATAFVPSSGYALSDTPVAISGQGLLAVTAARLIPDSGTSVTPITSWTAVDDQSVNAEVPANMTPGRYRLELVLGSASVATPAVFEVLATPPTPVLSALDPASGPNDRPHRVTLRGSDFVPGATVEVGGLPASSVAFVSSSELSVELPAGVPAGVQPVVVTQGSVFSAGGPDWEALNLADPDQVGIYEVGTWDGTMPGASGDDPDVRIYYPALAAGANETPDASGGPYPVVVLNHGFKPPLISFGIDYRNYTWAADYLTSHGYVVISVDLASNNSLFASGQRNSEQDADDTLAALDFLEASNVDPTHPLVGLIDASRAAFVGHSRGGDGALMAASAEVLARGAGARVKAVVSLGSPAFDSQNGGLALDFGDFTQVPALIVGGAADGIAPDRDQASIYGEAGSPAMRVEIDGANHSQFKDSERRIWGDSSATMTIADQHATTQRYLTAWLLAYVKGQQALADDYILGGSEAAADNRLSALESK